LKKNRGKKGGNNDEIPGGKYIRPVCRVNARIQGKVTKQIAYPKWGSVEKVGPNPSRESKYHWAKNKGTIILTKPFTGPPENQTKSKNH